MPPATIHTITVQTSPKIVATTSAAVPMSLLLLPCVHASWSCPRRRSLAIVSAIDDPPHKDVTQARTGPLNTRTSPLSSASLAAYHTIMAACHAGAGRAAHIVGHERVARRSER